MGDTESISDSASDHSDDENYHQNSEDNIPNSDVNVLSDDEIDDVTILKSLKILRKSIVKYRKNKRKTLGGCIYFLAGYYLDFLKFGSMHHIPFTIPRIKVWKGQMIKKFSSFDCVQPKKYGKRPVYSVEETCYAEASVSFTTSVGFRESLTADFEYLPEKVIEGLCDVYQEFSDHGFERPGYGGDSFIWKAFKFLKESKCNVGGDGEPDGNTNEGNVNPDDRSTNLCDDFNVNMDVNPPNNSGSKGFSVRKRANHSSSPIQSDSISSITRGRMSKSPQQKTNNLADIYEASVSEIYNRFKRAAPFDLDDDLHTSESNDGTTKENTVLQDGQGFSNVKKSASSYAPFFNDPSVPSFRLFDDEDDLGNFIQDPDLRRPVGLTTTPASTFSFNLQLHKHLHKSNVVQPNRTEERKDHLSTTTDEKGRVDEFQQEPQIPKVTNKDIHVSSAPVISKHDCYDKTYSHPMPSHHNNHNTENVSVQATGSIHQEQSSQESPDDVIIIGERFSQEKRADMSNESDKMYNWSFPSGGQSSASAVPSSVKMALQRDERITVPSKYKCSPYVNQ